VPNWDDVIPTPKDDEDKSEDAKDVAQGDEDQKIW
jgi:hypothetical protein